MSNEMTRRTFLKGSAAAAALGAASAVVPAFAEEEPMGEMAEAPKYSFETAPDPIPDEEIAETIEADVIVVGAGTSGLCTAVSAQESGLNVVLISASSFPISRGGSNHAFGSRLMDEMGVKHEDPGQALRKELLAAAGNVDERKWYNYVKDSREAMDWMLDLMDAEGVGYGLEGIPHLYDEGDVMYMSAGSHCFTDGTYPAGLGQQVAVEALATHFESIGGKVYYNNIGRQLIREDNNTGRVSAIIAEREDGTYAKYCGSKAIVLATGDFSSDPEMVAKYCPSVLPFIQNTDVDYNKGLFVNGIFPGDGQKMGLWVGAAWQKAPNAPMIIGGAYCAQPSLSHTGLVLNSKGQRISNEQSIFALSAIKNMQQTDGTTYGIWGSNYAEEGGPWYKANSWYEDAPATAEEMIATWDDAADTGLIFSGAASMGLMVKGDTIEEVIEKLGLPAETIETVNRYNELCEAGEDTDFCKDAKLMIPIKEGPFYGTGGAQSCLLTICGGLRTDENMAVCDENDVPIEGLYNVGIMVGDMYSGVYTFLTQGMNYGACITFGYRLGRHLAEI